MSPKLKQFTEDKINNLGSRDGAVVKSLASQQCDPGSILHLHYMWVEFVVGSRPCLFFPGSLVFPYPHKPTFLNSIWKVSQLVRLYGIIDNDNLCNLTNHLLLIAKYYIYCCSINEQPLSFILI